MSDWEDGPPPTDWVVLTTWIGGTVLSLVIYALAGWAIVSLLGCATGRIVRADVEMTCAAIGEDAKVTYSIPTGEAGVITSAPTQLIACEGGPLIPSLGTIIADAIKGLVFW